VRDKKHGENTEWNSSQRRQGRTSKGVKLLKEPTQSRNHLKTLFTSSGPFKKAISHKRDANLYCDKKKLL